MTNETNKTTILGITFNVFFSSDKMMAYIRASDYPKGSDVDNSFDKQVIYDLLAEYGIKYGIDDAAIEEYAKGKKLFKDLDVAHGLRPVNGTDGTAEFLFETNVSYAPKEREDGTVDYKDLGNIQNVAAGDLLCKISPPQEGTPGIDVLGTEVMPRQGKPAVVGYGNGAELSEDGSEIRATIDGMVEFTRGNIEVKNVYNIKGDVGPETGNISFNGAVVVQGNVLADYAIFAKGDIIVNGYVESSMLTSSGSVVIKNGVNGMKKGLIKADGDVTVKFAEMAKVIAGGDFTCDYSINSDIRAARAIIAKGKKGSLLGGTYIAGREVNAVTIGSELNIHMDLQLIPDWQHINNLKINPDERIKNYLEEIAKYEQEISANNKLMAKVDSDLLRITQKLAKETDKDEQQVIKKKALSLMEEKTKIKNSIEDIENHKRKVNIMVDCDGCTVVANNIIHTGVRVIMGTAVYAINGHMKQHRYVFDEGEIKAYSLV